MGLAGEGSLEYGLVMFVGLIVHGVFAECVTRAPGLLLQNVNLVKRDVFPLYVLSWTLMAGSVDAGRMEELAEHCSVNGVALVALRYAVEPVDAARADATLAGRALESR